MAKAGRFFAHVTDSELRRWRLKGRSIESIAALTGLTPQCVASRIHEIWSRASREATYEPPDEDTIRRRCLEIQSRWSEEERRHRAGLRDEAVNITVVPVFEILGRRS